MEECPLSKNSLMVLSRFESNENMYHHEQEHQKNPSASDSFLS